MLMDMIHTNNQFYTSTITPFKPLMPLPEENDIWICCQSPLIDNIDTNKRDAIKVKVYDQSQIQEGFSTPDYVEEDEQKATNNANLYEALLNVGFTRLRKPNRDLFETWDGTPGGGRRHILRIRLNSLQP